VVEGRAYLRIPFVGKLLLAHWAGAPWSDKNAGAFLSALQAEVLARRERVKIVHGGSGLGKSVLGGCDLLVANMLPFRKVAVVADRYDHVAHEFQYLHTGLRALFKGHGEAFKRLSFRNQQNYHEYESEPVWGTRTIGISTQSDEGAQLLGREFTDVVCGEGSHIPVPVHQKKLLRAIDRAMMDREHGLQMPVGNLSLYTTPDGYAGASAYEWERIKKTTRNHPELLHYGAVPWPQTAWLREATVLENPSYSREVYAARKATLDKAAFAEQYGGKMTYASGRVWRSYNEDTHVRPMPSAEYIRGMRLGVGIDTGAFTGIVLGGIGRDGKRWILGETYTEKPAGGIYTTLELAEEMLLRVLTPAFAGAELQRLLDDVIFLVSIDPASQHKLEIIDRWNTALTSPNTADQKSLLQTIDRVEKWFQDEQLFIVESCENMIDQISKYVWKQMKAPTSQGAPVIREPSKGYDHLCDALRFLLIPLDEYGVPTEPPPVFTWAQEWASYQRNRFFGPLKKMMAAGLQRESIR
jgi:hypothetical protein